MIIRGTKKNDLLQFADSAEPVTVLGRKGQDFIEGSAYDDILKGGRGDDILIGGGGADLLIGGRGHDIFMFDLEKVSEASRIRKFKPTVDLIVVEAGNKATADYNEDTGMVSVNGVEIVEIRAGLDFDLNTIIAIL